MKKENELWIALKSWYLWYSEQRIMKFSDNIISCELLSKVDIFDIRNNNMRLNKMQQTVVNCSQKLISLIFGTTDSAPFVGDKSCELLSKVDIFDIRNNATSATSLLLRVVNCSQKLISLIFGTTIWHVIWSLIKLWIALKSWYLWYSEQQ